MARGPKLTTAEKYSIRGMLEDALPVSKIATTLRRSETVVRKYIEEEFSHTAEFIAKEKDLMSKEVVDAAMERLTSAGYTAFDARSVISRMKRKITKEVTMNDLDAIVRWAQTNKTPKDLIVTKSDGGRNGVAVMQQGASEHLDELRQNRKPRNLSGHIFRQEDAE